MPRQMTQGERIVKIETDIVHIKENLNEHTIQEEKFQDYISDMVRKIDEKIDGLDSKYASKKIETVFWWAAGIGGSVLIGAFVTFIINGGLI